MTAIGHTPALSTLLRRRITFGSLNVDLYSWVRHGAAVTFPPLLLQALPRLPDDLEYRFMGRDLIIRDGRTNLIVDYLSDVMTIATAVTP